jgi:hypothetical protein
MLQYKIKEEAWMATYYMYYLAEWDILGIHYQRYVVGGKIEFLERDEYVCQTNI